MNRLDLPENTRAQRLVTGPYQAPPSMEAAIQQMAASHATMRVLANGAPIRLGAGPDGKEPCLHYFTEGNGLVVYAWLDGAAWGVEPIIYRILGEVISGPTSQVVPPRLS